MARKMLNALINLVLCFFAKELTGKEIFISKAPGSLDISKCGNQTLPCSTVAFALLNIAQENDDVYLDNKPDYQSIFIEKHRIIVRQGISIQSRYINKPRAVLLTHHAALFYMHCIRLCHFNVSNIDIKSPYAGIYLPSKFKGYFTIKNVFINSKVSFFGRENQTSVSIEMRNVRSRAIAVTGNIRFVATDCIFQVDRLFMTLEPKSKTDNISVIFQNSQFHNGTFTFESPVPNKDGMKTNNIVLSSLPNSNTIKFIKSTFKEFQVTIRYGQRIRVLDSTFLANTQMLSSNKQHYLAFIQAYQTNDIIIKHSTFQDSYFGAISLSYCSKVNIADSHFVGNSKFIEEGQGGGAILSHFSEIDAYGCEFVNNTAVRGGGTMHSIGGKLNIENTSIVTNDSTALNSAIFCQSRGSLKNVSLKITNPRREKRTVLTLLPFNDDFKNMGTWNILDEGLSITCPMNHVLDTFAEVSPYSNTNNRFTDITTTCKQCPKQTYSFDKGQQWFKTEGNKSISLKHNIKCLRCATEADCDSEGIVSKGNYWGYRSGDVVKFVPCPTYYCCSRHTTPCISYNSCAFNRKGNICGTCSQGYSEDIFSATCLLSSHCSQGVSGFWVFYVFGSFLFTLFLMYMKDLFKAIKGCLCCKQKHHLEMEEVLSAPLLSEDAGQDSDSEEKEIVISSDSNGYAVETGLDSNGHSMEFAYNEIPTESTNLAFTNDNLHEDSTFSGFFKILVQYYQIISLVRVRSPSKDTVTTLQTNPFLEFIISLFNIKIVSTTDRLRAISLCPIPHMTAAQKEFLLASFPFSLMLCVILLYLATFLFKKVAPSFNNKPIYRKLVQRNSKPFIVRLKGVIVQIILLGYVTISVYLLEMVNCLPINGIKMLYIQGDVVCYQGWQYLVFIFIFTWMAPFSFTIYISSQMLAKKILTSKDFLVTLFFPIYSFYRMLKPKRVQKTDVLNDSETKQHFLTILSGPFRRTFQSDHKDIQCDSHLFWESTLILRRILLTVVFVFIIHPVIKSYIMLALLLLYLVHHIFVKPYSSKILNLTESLSLMLLNLLCGLNLYWAYSNVINTESMAYHFNIAEAFIYIEVFIVTAPLFFLVIYLCCALLKRLVNKLGA